MTVRDIYNEQMPEIRDLLISRLLPGKEDIEAGNFGSAIDRGFIWESTPEGSSFWSRIAAHENKHDETEFNALRKKAGIYIYEENNITQLKFIKKNSYTEYVVSFYKSPFDNCQNFSIANFCSLLTSIPKEHFTATINGLFSYTKKKILVVDVNETFVMQIKSLFPKVVGELPYVSTNGSKMTIMLLKPIPTKYNQMTVEVMEDIKKKYAYNYSA